jgi:hypothetical protein
MFRPSALLLLCVLAVAPVGAQRVTADLDALPFAPRRYVCYRVPSRLNIDGKLDEQGWAAAAWSDAFIDIEGDGRPRPPFRTRVKMAWDDEFFYVAAEMEEPDVWATLTERDSVIFHDNDFEIFIDPATPAARQLPDLCFGFYDRMVIFDHIFKTIFV